MNFVNEQDGSASHPTRAFRIGHHGLDLFDPRENCAKRNIIGFRQPRDYSGKSRFSDPGRSPQNDRRKLVTLDLRTEWFARPEDMFLADEVFEFFRPHALGERTFWIVGKRRRFEKAHFVIRISDTSS